MIRQENEIGHKCWLKNDSTELCKRSSCYSCSEFQREIWDYEDREDFNSDEAEPFDDF